MNITTINILLSIRTLKFFICLFFLFFFTFSSCGEKEILAPQIMGIRSTIQRILINPIAFGSAVVAVEGIAHDIREEKAENDVPKTFFKIYDIAGNFINVSMPTSWVVMDNDFMVVGGMYRRIENEIEANQIEVIVLEE